MKRSALVFCVMALALACNKSDDKTSCGPGTVLQGDACVVPLTCGVGKVLQGGSCVDITCAAGYVLAGNECVDIDECSPQVVSFHKTRSGTEEDCITPEVCITRGEQWPIYNSVVDPYTQPSCDDAVPTGTLWARGACAWVESADFGPFLSGSFASCEPPSIVAVPGCLQVGDQYFDIQFGSWLTQGYGGEFSYERREAICGAGLACVNTPGSYACACNPGYELQDGVCVEVDECAAGTDGCGENATCENMIGSYRCACDADISFVKEDFGSEEDCITADVCLTRGDQYPMYNSVLESQATEAGCFRASPSPAGTLWAFGECSSVEPDQFGVFMGEDFASCYPPSVVGNPACLKAGDLYFDITFDSWTSGASGGGFSYTRTDTVPPGVACEAATVE
jgi:hypothetical protein